MTDPVINPPAWIDRQLRSSIWKPAWLTASQSSTLAQPKLIQNCEWMWRCEFSQVHLKDPTWRLDGAMTARHHGDNFDHGWWKGGKTSCLEMANMFSLGNPENEALIAFIPGEESTWRVQDRLFVMSGFCYFFCCPLVTFSPSFLLQ